MAESDDIRKGVSKAYARAVEAAAPTTGTAGGCCGGRAAPKGVTAQVAGYGPLDLAALPDDAVVNAFGCGNPLAFADVREGEVVLDLGCGAGIDLILAGRRVGPSGRVVGVDMTDAMIARARANVRAAGLEATVEIREGLIEALPVEDASVDLVISNCVINLSPEKARVFAEIARVLRPGGRIRISDLVAEDLPEAVRADPRVYACCIGGAISEAAYVAGLEAAGLVDVRVEERLRYTASQIGALVGSETGASCCGASGAPAGLSPAVCALLAEHVWSARFHGNRAVG